MIRSQKGRLPHIFAAAASVQLLCARITRELRRTRKLQEGIRRLENCNDDDEVDGPLQFGTWSMDG
jgi:hypothetical protein